MEKKRNWRLRTITIRAKLLFIADFGGLKSFQICIYPGVHLISEGNRLHPLPTQLRTATWSALAKVKSNVESVPIEAATCCCMVVMASSPLSLSLSLSVCLSVSPPSPYSLLPPHKHNHSHTHSS